MADIHERNPDLLCVKKDYPGNQKKGRRFLNDYTNNHEKPSLLPRLKWKIHSIIENKKERNRLNKQELVVKQITTLDTATNQIIWLGHASILLILSGKKILLDPLLFGLPFFPRKIKAPSTPEQLGDIDYVCISHAHRDHLDTKTLKRLKGNNIHALVGLGTKKVVEQANKNIHAQEAGWWQEFMIDDDFHVIFLPAHHWTNRSGFDTNRFLWGSFLFITKNTTIYFGGDTAYSEHFKDIRAQFGPIDICILPIGAYAPRELFLGQHMDPQGAVQAFKDLDGKLFIPIHHGTFGLSEETGHEALLELQEALSQENLGTKLRMLRIGEPLKWVKKK